MKRRALITCLEAHPLAVQRAIAAKHGIEVEGMAQEQMVQEVPEFVKNGLHLVMGKKSWLVFKGWCEISANKA